MPSKRLSPQHIALLVHRYVGLFIAAFLLLAGVTGCIIAFDTELDAAINPHLFWASPPTPEAPMLDPFVLQRAVQQAFPDAQLDAVSLRQPVGHASDFWIDGKEVFVNPYTAEVLGSRKWGDIGEGWGNLIPFIYRLHFSLALEEVGTFVFGVVALLWFIDCFVGAYLTFPKPSPGKAKRTPARWLASWAPLWLVKANKLFTLIFTWHRASGLWVWLLLIVFAWSGVALNLNDEVYEPVMSRVLGPEEDPHAALPTLSEPRTRPALSLEQARDVGKRLMAEQATARGFDVLEELYVAYDSEHGAYTYGVESTLDVSARLADTTVTFDSDSGELHTFNAPTGQNAYQSVRSWLIAVHFGEVRIGGLGYRIFVSVLGLVVAALSVSGVWIWWVKRARRTIAT